MTGVEFVEKAEAARLLREAARVDEESGRTLIHSFSLGGGMALGADHDIETATEYVEQADRIAWVTHPFLHELAVAFDSGRLYLYDVRRPTNESGEDG